MQQLKGNISEASPGIWTCPHVDPKVVKGAEPIDGTYLRLEWASANVLVGVCKRCARSSKDSSIVAISRHMAVPKLENDFKVQVLHRLEGAADCSLWDRLSRLSLDDEVLDDYLKGQIDDAATIDRHLVTVDDALRDHRGPHFILGNKCYCDDAKTFVEALSPSEEERLALEAVLPLLDSPLVLDRATPAKVLAELWEDHGEEALHAVVGGDEELLAKYVDHPDVQSSPSTVLKRALIDHRKDTIISKLPSYDRLPMIARFADKVARAYRTEGSRGAMRTLEKERGSDTRIKSVAYAFLLTLGKEASKKWQYDRTEMDFAAFLKEKAGALLEAEPDEYHEALQAILSATGSTERIPEPRG
jgi:hypothetical protein